MGADLNQWQFPRNEANKLLGWRPNGKGLENKDPIDIIGGIAEEIRELIGRFDVVADVEAENIPSALDSIQTDGYSAPGDGGGALYKRVETEPGHAGKIQSADGAWWELAADQRFSVEMFGGSFTDLETFVSGSLIDLNGKTYLVEAIPTGNTYVNGFWTIDGQTVPANQDAATISASSDTGALEDPAGGGGTVNPDVHGRTTHQQNVVVAARNGRAAGIRTFVAAGFDVMADGNISSVIASRDCTAEHNTTIVVSSEDCYSRNRKGTIIGAIRCVVEGQYGTIAASQDCFTSTNTLNGGRQFVAASQATTVGQGFGCRFDVELDEETGEILSLTPNPGGQDYEDTDTISIEDTLGGGTGAEFTPTIEGGVVTATTKVSGGSGYSSAGLRVLMVSDGASYNAAIAVTASKNRSGTTLLAGGRSGEAIKGSARSFMGGFDGSTLQGDASVVLAADGSALNGTNSALLGSNQTTLDGNLAVALSAAFSDINHGAGVTIGRRVATADQRMVTIGDAAAGDPLTANRKIQMNIQNGNISAAGTITGSTVFTDYAEYFPNHTNGAIPLGTIVTLEGRNVRVAGVGDPILGVVSATALVKAGDSPFHWQARYLTGEFGEQLYQDVECVSWDKTEACPHAYDGIISEALLKFGTIPEHAVFSTERHPIENPDFDPARQNIPRSERPDEWTCVGLLGQVHVRVDETVSANGYVAAGANGIGTAANGVSNLRCMEIRRLFDPEKGYAVAFCMTRPL